MPWIAVGGLLAAAAVAAGAFGAHGLASRLDARGLELWETAARYLAYAAFGELAVGLLARLSDRTLAAPGLCLLVGALVFSGSLFALALGGPRRLGMITPAGGLLLILGFLLLAWQGIRGGP